MSFLYKRLAKIGKLAAKKEAESKYDDVPAVSEELNDNRTDEQSNKEKEK